MSLQPSGPAQCRPRSPRRLALLCLCLLAAVPGSHAASQDEDDGAAVSRRRYYPPPYLCYHLVGLGVDYLNDDTPPPHAFSITTGTLETGALARFAVYGIDRFGVYSNVGGFFPDQRPYQPKLLHVKVEAAHGSPRVDGRFRYYRGDSEAPAQLIYVPRKRSRVDRTAIITFKFQCDQTWTTQFILNIPAEEPR